MIASSSTTKICLRPAVAPPYPRFGPVLGETTAFLMKVQRRAPKGAMPTRRTIALPETQRRFMREFPAERPWTIAGTSISIRTLMEDRVLVNNALRPDEVGPAAKRLLLRRWTPCPA